MRLTVFNGSPRVKGSNTALLVRHLVEGFRQAGGQVEAECFLARGAGRARHVELFARAEVALLAFPLYVDAMPAPVKAFIEELAPLVGRPGNPQLLYLVQSGFPEACHSRPVQAYLEKLARRLGARCLGTIVKAGAEGIRDMPPAMTRRLFARMNALGSALARTGELDPGLLAAVAGWERFPRLAAPLWAPATKLMTRGWWDLQLRRHGAYERRDAAPYAPARGEA